MIYLFHQRRVPWWWGSGAHSCSALLVALGLCPMELFLIRNECRCGLAAAVGMLYQGVYLGVEVRG